MTLLNKTCRGPEHGDFTTSLPGYLFRCYLPQPLGLISILVKLLTESLVQVRTGIERGGRGDPTSCSCWQMT